MKQNKMAKFVAIFALLWIFISIAGTGLLIIFQDNSNQNVELTAEEFEMLQQQYLESLSGSTASWSTQVEINNNEENIAE